MLAVLSFVVIAIYVLVVAPLLLIALTVPLNILAQMLDAAARGLNAWSERQARPPVPLVRSSVPPNAGPPNPWL
jgi:hypothetical protein